MIEQFENQQIAPPEIISRLHARTTIDGQTYLFEKLGLQNGFTLQKCFLLTSEGWKETQNIKQEQATWLFDREKNQVEIIDPPSGEILRYLDRLEPFVFKDSINLMIKSQDKDQWTAERQRMENLVPIQEERNALIAKIQKESCISLENLAEYLNQLEVGDVKKSMFKGIDYQREIGVSRFITDRVYHLPKLLEKLELHLVQENHYKLSASEDTSAGTVGFEYRFLASCDEEAKKIAHIFKQKIVGTGERLWLACWLEANRAGNWCFEIETINLYRTFYPDRKAHPNGEERKQFICLLRDLERTKYFLTRNKKKAMTYELPVIQIIAHSPGTGDSKEWPRRLTLQVLPLSAHEDKMSHVGASFSKRLLHLDSADLHLASALQIRRAQCRGKEILGISLEDLFQHAGLSQMAKRRPAYGKKLLLNKLSRLKKEGCIMDYPHSLPKNFKENIEICFHSKLGIQMPQVGGSDAKKCQNLGDEM